MKRCISAPFAPGSSPLVLGTRRWATSVVLFSSTVDCWVCLFSGSLSVWLTPKLSGVVSTLPVLQLFQLLEWSFSTNRGEPPPQKKKSMQMKVVQVLTACCYLNIKGQWCVPIHAFWCVFIVSLSNILPLKSSSDLSDLKYSQVVLLIVWSRNQRFAWKSIEVHYFKSHKANH